MKSIVYYLSIFLFIVSTLSAQELLPQQNSSISLSVSAGRTMYSQNTINGIFNSGPKLTSVLTTNDIVLDVKESKSYSTSMLYGAQFTFAVQELKSFVIGVEYFSIERFAEKQFTMAIENSYFYNSLSSKFLFIPISLGYKIEIQNSHIAIEPGAVYLFANIDDTMKKETESSQDFQKTRIMEQDWEYI